MEVNYKLNRVRELAGGDEDFIAAIAAAFIEEVPEAIAEIKEGLQHKDYKQVYQNAHKIKPTVEMFDMGVFEELLVIQDWGKFEQEGKDVSAEFEKLTSVVDTVVKELTADFDL